MRYNLVIEFDVHPDDAFSGMDNRPFHHIVSFVSEFQFEANRWHGATKIAEAIVGALPMKSFTWSLFEVRNDLCIASGSSS